MAKEVEATDVKYNCKKTDALDQERPSWRKVVCGLFSQEARKYK